jgi:hypothetical protein
MSSVEQNPEVLKSLHDASVTGHEGLSCDCIDVANGFQ